MKPTLDEMIAYITNSNLPNPEMRQAIYNALDGLRLPEAKPSGVTVPVEMLRKWALMFDAAAHCGVIATWKNLQTQNSKSHEKQAKFIYGLLAAAKGK